MRHSIPTGAAAVAGALFVTVLAASPQASHAADCVPPGGSDANGDGFPDDLVSTSAVIIASDVGCSTRIGARSVVVGARLEEAEEFDTPRPAVVGEGSFVGPRATLQGATIGDSVFVLANARLSAGINSEVTLGNRSFVGRNAWITSGNSPTEIGDGAFILGDVLILGARLGPGARIGSGSELRDFGAGRGVTIGSGSRLGFRAGAGDDVRIGVRSEIGTEVSLGDGVSIGANADIGPFAFIGKHTEIGEFVTIGNGADIGENVRIDDFARIEERATVPDGTVIGRGETFAGPT